MLRQKAPNPVSQRTTVIQFFDQNPAPVGILKNKCRSPCTGPWSSACPSPPWLAITSIVRIESANKFRRRQSSRSIVRFHQTGGPEVLKIEQTETKQPGPGEVRIAVKALGLEPGRVDVPLRPISGNSRFARAPRATRPPEPSTRSARACKDSKSAMPSARSPHSRRTSMAFMVTLPSCRRPRSQSTPHLCRGPRRQRSGCNTPPLTAH